MLRGAMIGAVAAGNGMLQVAQSTCRLAGACSDGDAITDCRNRTASIEVPGKYVELIHAGVTESHHTVINFPWLFSNM